MSTSSYPVHVDAQLDQKLSRGLWMVKWLLVIPHYIVLAFLWLAFMVLSMVAFFAILFTGRYPRSIFEFNVGVLRWSWRVAYYAYGALGTDRYPPFSLADYPDYPAHLEVEYPEQLSRRLVLVKWWLLALPHYLIVGLFLSGGLYITNQTTYDEELWIWGSGLIGLLVLVAGFVLLFTGRYPQSIFDLVLGMNRWVLRVAGYAALMTDTYPPFRLDQGGDDPGASQLTLPREPMPTRPTGHGILGAPPPSPATTEPSPWTGGRIVGLVLGSLLLTASLGVTAGGAVLAVADQNMRDRAGFITSGPETFTTDGYAITSTDVEVHAADGLATLPAATIGDIKITASSTGDVPLFLGIASTVDVDRYLDDVRHATVVDMTPDPVYRLTDGTAPATPPGAADFWLAQTSGGGTQSLVWSAQSGDWTVVVMNVDGTAGIATEAAIGATVPALDWAVPVLLSVGGTGLAVAAIVLLLVVSSAQRALREWPTGGR